MTTTIKKLQFAEGTSVTQPTDLTILNPMTTRGDIIRGGIGGAQERLGAATDNRVLAGDGTDVVSKQIDDPAFFSSGAYATGAAAGTLPPVTSMGGVLATQLGHKQYLIGTAYANGTPTLSSTPTGWSMTRGVLIPRQMSDGTWRLAIQLRGTWTSTATASFTLSGVTSRNVSNLNQALAAAPQTTTAGTYGVWSPNSGNFSSVSEATQAGGAIYGEIELESKPTWAD